MQASILSGRTPEIKSMDGVPFCDGGWPCPSVAVALEDQLERELRNAWLVGSRSRILRSCSGDLAERATQGSARVAKIHMVHQVEVLGAELQKASFRNWESARQACVPVDIAGANIRTFDDSSECAG